jgi:pimeloyl-ACP methyl ester carboxylesterase
VAVRLVQQLEELRAADITALVGEDVEAPGDARVIALADAAMFHDLAGSRTEAYYSVNEWGEPYIFAQVNSEGSVRETLAHELAHYVSRYLFPVRPHWFAEGLAGFVQMLAGKERAAGPVPPYADRCYLARHIPTLLVWGARDAVIPSRHAQIAHLAMPGSRLGVFEGAGHFPHLSDGPCFLSLVRDFLATTAPARYGTEERRDALRRGRLLRGRCMARPRAGLLA